MNLPLDREFISQVVIVVAVCAGAWFMLVQPKAEELTRLEHELAETAGNGAFATPQGIEALVAKMQSFEGRLDEIKRRNAAAEDTSALYGTIMNLAAEHRVKVLAVQPAPLKETSKESPVKASRLEITVQGRFDEIARFLDQMCAMDAFIRPMSLQVTPIDGAGDGLVTARFGCDVLAIAADVLNKGVANAPAGGPANGQS